MAEEDAEFLVGQVVWAKVESVWPRYPSQIIACPVETSQKYTVRCFGEPPMEYPCKLKDIERWECLAHQRYIKQGTNFRGSREGLQFNRAVAEAEAKASTVQSMDAQWSTSETEVATSSQTECASGVSPTLHDSMGSQLVSQVVVQARTAVTKTQGATSDNAATDLTPDSLQPAPASIGGCGQHRVSGRQAGGRRQCSPCGMSSSSSISDSFVSPPSGAGVSKPGRGRPRRPPGITRRQTEDTDSDVCDSRLDEVGKIGKVVGGQFSHASVKNSRRLTRLVPYDTSQSSSDDSLATAAHSVSGVNAVVMSSTVELSNDTRSSVPVASANGVSTSSNCGAVSSAAAAPGEDTHGEPSGCICRSRVRRRCRNSSVSSTTSPPALPRRGRPSCARNTSTDEESLGGSASPPVTPRQGIRSSPRKIPLDKGNNVSCSTFPPVTPRQGRRGRLSKSPPDEGSNVSCRTSPPVTPRRGRRGRLSKSPPDEGNDVSCSTSPPVTPRRGRRGRLSKSPPDEGNDVSCSTSPPVTPRGGRRGRLSKSPPNLGSNVSCRTSPPVTPCQGRVDRLSKSPPDEGNNVSCSTFPPVTPHQGRRGRLSKSPPDEGNDGGHSTCTVPACTKQSPPDLYRHVGAAINSSSGENMSIPLQTDSVDASQSIDDCRPRAPLPNVRELENGEGHLAAPEQGGSSSNGVAVCVSARKQMSELDGVMTYVDNEVKDDIQTTTGTVPISAAAAATSASLPQGEIKDGMQTAIGAVPATVAASAAKSTGSLQNGSSSLPKSVIENGDGATDNGKSTLSSPQRRSSRVQARSLQSPPRQNGRTPPAVQSGGGEPEARKPETVDVPATHGGASLLVSATDPFPATADEMLGNACSLPTNGQVPSGDDQHAITPSIAESPSANSTAAMSSNATKADTQVSETSVAELLKLPRLRRKVGLHVGKGNLKRKASPSPPPPPPPRLFAVDTTEKRRTIPAVKSNGRRSSKRQAAVPVSATTSVLLPAKRSRKGGAVFDASTSSANESTSMETGKRKRRNQAKAGLSSPAAPQTDSASSKSQGTSATTAISSRGDMVSSQDTMMSSSCSRPVTSSQQGTEPVLPASPALSPIRTVVTCATDIEMENSSNSDMSDLELLNSSSLECTTTPKSISSFEEKDLVWARYKSPFWPAIVQKPYSKRSKCLKVVFLTDNTVKQKSRSYRISNVSKVLPFDYKQMEHKNHGRVTLKGDLLRDFESACQKADEILRLRAFGDSYDEIIPEVMSADSSRRGSSDEECCPAEEVTGAVEGTASADASAGASADTAEGTASQASLASQTPAPMRKALSPKYNDIELLRKAVSKQKGTLLLIFAGKRPSQWHTKFSGSDKDRREMMISTHFGPVTDSDTQRLLYQELYSIFEDDISETARQGIPRSYVFDVWLPEFLVRYVMHVQGYRTLKKAEEFYMNSM